MHRFGTSSGAVPTTRTTAVANGDLPTGGGNSGGWSNEAANGFGMLASGSQSAGAFVVAINTTGLNTIVVQWKAGTILQQASRDMSLALQYRVGTSATWTDVGTTTTYTSQGKTEGTFSGVLSETLPVAAENKSVVQVRWIYWESNGTTGSRDRIALDNVSITGTSTPVVVAPTVTSAAVSALTATSATLGGNVTATGGAAILGNGSVYSVTATNANPIIGGSGVTQVATVTPAAGTGAFVNVTGTTLDANTQYSYKAYATNSIGTSYGSVITFYTLANVPGTPVVSNATTSSLDVAIDANANPANTTFAIMEAGGQYVQANGTLGATAFYQTAASWGIVTVSGLAANTQYTFSVIAQNGASVNTTPSTSQSGTTLSITSPILTVGTLPAFGDICVGDSAIGSFSFDGANLTSQAITIGALEGFSYSLSEMGTYTSTLSFPSSTTMTGQVVWVKFSPAMIGSFDGPISISGGGTTSEYTVAASGAGVITSAMVETGGESNVTSIQATLDGSFTMGCSAVTEFGIEYSTESDFVAGTQVAGSVENNGDFSVTVVGLEPNTIYYYKAYATDDSATIYGNQMSFITQNLATPLATDATDITLNSFVANWEAVPGATSYRIDVSTSETFGTTGPATTTTEPFEGIAGGTTSSYLTRTWNGAAGIGWTAYKARIDEAVDGYDNAITLQNQAGAYLISDPIAGGVSNISFIAQQRFAGSNGVLTISVLSGNDYTTTTVLGTHNYDTSVSTYNSGPLSIAGSYKIRIDNNASARAAIDNLAFTSMPTQLPSFVIEDGDAGSGTSFEVGGLQSGTQYYYRVRAVSGTNTSDSSNVIDVFTEMSSLSFAAISTDGPVCDGELATFTVTGLSGNTAQVLAYSIGEGASQTVEVTSNGDGVATFAIELNSEMNGMQLTVTMVSLPDNSDSIMVTSNNTVTLEVTLGQTYYADADGDGFGDAATTIFACSQPANYVSNDTDCNDNDANTYQSVTVYIDMDGDGFHGEMIEDYCFGNSLPQNYSTSTNGFDCNDDDAAINPSATEIPNNGIDENCNGMDDDAVSTGLTTMIKANVCGTTLGRIYSTISAQVSIANVTMYTFEITDPNNVVQTISTTNNYFQLTDLASYEYSTAYSVRVGVFVNGVWQGYGMACTVSTPDTNIVIPQCGTTLAQPYSTVSVTGPNFISGYEIRVTNNLGTQTITRTQPFFSLKMFPSIYNSTVSRVNSVEVRVKTTGAYGPWTPMCSITTPAFTGAKVAGSAANFTATAYPNPYTDTFTLNLQSSSEAKVQVKIYDMVGKLLEVRNVAPTNVEAQRLGNVYPSGVYNVIVTQGDMVETLRVIKR